MAYFCADCGIFVVKKEGGLCNYCEEKAKKEATTSLAEIKRKDKARAWLNAHNSKEGKEKVKKPLMWQGQSQGTSEQQGNKKDNTFVQDFFAGCIFFGAFLLLQNYQVVSEKISWLFGMPIEKAYLIGTGWLLGVLLLAIYLFTVEQIPKWLKIATTLTLSPIFLIAALFLP